MEDGEQLLQGIYEQLNITGSPDDFFRHYSDTQTMLFLDLASKVGFPEEPLTTAADEKMATAQLNAGMTNRLFPWHFAVDKDMKIVSLGKHLASRMKKDCIGMHAEKLFRIARPIDATWDFEDIKARCDKPFLFVTNPKRMLSAEEYAAMLSERQQRLAQEDREQRHSNLIQQFEQQSSSSQATSGRASARTSTQLPAAERSGAGSLRPSGCPMTGMRHSQSSATTASTSAGTSARSSMDLLEARSRHLKKASHIKLHGEVVFDEDKQVLLFVGNPFVQSMEELEAQGIDLTDLPVHSHGREVLYGSMCQAISASNSNDVEAKLADLDRSMAEVHSKKEQIDGLLHSILPPVVADSLARGEIPAAEQYEHVTVLFSDIAGFTNISSEVPSLEVMDMLHELFVKFDDLADQHGCYKVETIGDAYMVTAGCPEECEDHALRIARLAIDMVRTAQTVLSPLDGEPLRIRVGLHSGPLMAGVVGRARPRYCLFGDTVNVASRMESNGLPGCIQATYRFLRALPGYHRLIIAPRGRLEIKGKGTIKTFLVLGEQDGSDTPPLLPEDDGTEELSDELNMIRVQYRMQSSIYSRSRPVSATSSGPQGLPRTTSANGPSGPSNARPQQRSNGLGGRFSGVPPSPTFSVTKPLTGARNTAFSFSSVPE
ncbi:NO-insensitive guanylyl cyclase III [Salpingoeca rosetta]|uniref:guanylate cyclase n=1 Tax=Salpingoeca rosetta (strain ATCC 50818 / BSB-021) TaxID=946362 RepID=F2TZ99_SALR5|nr:NO-insensitive guanylyl cyclase III [Salpingoeca rosetta]EGD78923.1 NO-insensitive guanylyl cyclase III [Salpingoeca rosetta]|eukprot:XP_004997879.1 NO-insensitive guanylyl cyclase III [Salpingoeca rosetta]